MRSFLAVFLLSFSILAAGPTTTGKLRYRQVAGASFNVLDYGAKCDGLTDDSVAIQNAVAAAQTAGGSVYIPSSTSGCVIPTGGFVNVSASNVTVYGDGPSSIIYIKGSTWRTSTVTGYFQVGNSSATIANIHFHHLHFVGDYPFGTAGPSAAIGAINIGIGTTYLVNNVSVADCTFEKLGGMGVGFAGGSATVYAVGESVTHNVFINSGSTNDQVNAYTYGHRGTIIANNEFRDVYGSALEWAGTSATITSNHFDHVAGWAVAFDNAASSAQDDGYTTVANNTILNAGTPPSGTQMYHCIQLGETNGVVRTRVLNNSIRNCAGGGIVMTGAMSDVEISGNYVDCAGYNASGKTVAFADFTGIHGRGVLRTRVTNNTVVACSGAGHQSNYGINFGGNSLTDGWADGNVTIGTFLQKSIVTSVSLGGNGGGTRQWAGRNFDVTAGRYIASMDQSNVETLPFFAASATQPSVAGNPFNVWRTNNSVSTQIDKFLNPYPGQVINIHFADSVTTLSSSCGSGAYFICLKDNAYKKFTSGDQIQLMFNESEWREVAIFRQNTAGTCTLGTSCASINVPADCKAICTDTTAAAACKASVSGTTLTITGTGTDVINWFCPR